MKSILPLVALSLALSSFTHAQTNGVWTNTAAGNWSAATNWSGGNVAGGTNASADFNTINITADTTVTLDTPVTIGSLIFGDTDTNSAAGWTLSSGPLTLAGTNPIVTVNALGGGKSVTFGAQVAGTNGLIKSGTGRFVLNNSSNNYTGSISNSFMSFAAFGTPLFATVVEQGRLVLGSSTAAGTGNILVITNPALLAPLTAFLDLNGNTVANNIGIAGDTYLYNGNTSNAATVNGDVWVRNFGRIGSAAVGEAGTVIVNGKIVFSGSGVSLFTGLSGALVVFNGSVTHSNSNGAITVQTGTLRAQDGVNIATNSTLRIGNPTGNSGGIFESSANMTRLIGTNAGEISVGPGSTTNTNIANIGFSAFGAPITVALGGTSSPTALTWGQTNFLQVPSILVLNGATANNTLTFVNSINLAGSNRTITVNAATAIVNGGLTNGALTKAGAGTLVLGGTNAFTADTTITGGTLRTSLNNFAGNVIMTNNSTFALDEATNSDFTGIISGAGSFGKAGAGTLTLSASNSYSGNTAISAGALRLATSNSLGVTTNAVSVADGATLDLNGQNNANRVVTIAGSGSGSLGAVVNNGTNSATGLRLAFTSAVSIGGTTRIDTSFVGATPNINGGTNTLTKVGTNQFTINVGAVSMGTFNITQGNVVSVNTATSLGDAAFGTVVSSNASLAFFNSSTNALTNNEPITLAEGAELGGNTATSRNVLGGPITLSGGTATVRVEVSGTSTLQINGGFTGPGGINKTSGGTLELRGTNTHTGNTTIAGGSVTLVDGARLAFVIGGNGTNNAVNGTGTFNAEGIFDFDLTGASTTTGATWTIVAPTVTDSYGTNFIVSGFSGAGGSWTNTTNGATYVFTQSNSVLTVQSGATNNYASWVSYWQGVSPGFTNTAGTANPDGDPFDNNEEFAFDGNPTIGSPALLTATKVGTNAVFQWVQRKDPPGGVTYAVQKTPNLTIAWTNASVTVSNSANTNGINIPADYERKEFVVPAAGKDFYRVEATIAP